MIELFICPECKTEWEAPIDFDYKRATISCSCGNIFVVENKIEFTEDMFEV